MKIRFALNLFLSIVFAGGATAFAAEPVGTPTVGFVIAQSGVAAWWGKHIINGMTLADEAQGASKAVKFVVEDDQFSSKNAVTAATKLLAENVSALVTFGGGSSTAVAEIAERRKVPLIGISGADGFSRERKFVFRLFMSNEDQMELLTAEAKSLKLKSMGVIATQQETMVDFMNLFAAKNPGLIQFTETIQPSDVDMAPLATKIRGRNPDGLVLFVNPPHLAPLTKLLRGQRYAGPFIGGVNIFNPSEIKASDGALVGTLFPAPDSTNAQAFVDLYRKRFSESPPSEAFYGYDVATLLIDAARSGDLVRYLQESKEMRGLSGIFPRHGQSFDVPAKLRRVVNETSAE